MAAPTTPSPRLSFAGYICLLVVALGGPGCFFIYTCKAGLGIASISLIGPVESVLGPL